MNARELEALVLSILRRAGAGQKVEDNRTELKREWPTDHSRAARHIAALCNACRSPWALWVVGVGPDGAIRRQSEPELANWWPQVQRHFQGVGPTLLQSPKVVVGDEHVSAMLFDASRSPYVWRIPHQEGVKGPADLEFPWREGERTRSARREDLLSIMQPMVREPRVMLMDGELSYGPLVDRPEPLRLSGHVQFYVAPRGRRPVVFPGFLSSARLVVPGWLEPLDLGVGPLRVVGGPQRVGFIETTSFEVIARGPGSVMLCLDRKIGRIATPPRGRLLLQLRFPTAEAPDGGEYEIEFVPRQPDGDFRYWTAGEHLDPRA